MSEKFIPTKISGSIERRVYRAFDEFVKSQKNTSGSVTKLERLLFSLEGKYPADVCITIYKIDPDLLRSDPSTGGRVKR